jgi:hypothetical protein
MSIVNVLCGLVARKLVAERVAKIGDDCLYWLPREGGVVVFVRGA